MVVGEPDEAEVTLAIKLLNSKYTYSDKLKAGSETTVEYGSRDTVKWHVVDSTSAAHLHLSRQGEDFLSKTLLFLFCVHQCS
jgi:hypothetical protein